MLFTNARLEQAYSYPAYRELIQDLLAEGKSTGENQSEALTEYSRLNDRRMARWEKTYKPGEDLLTELRTLEENWAWVLLTEGWCGDAAQNVPLIWKLTELSQGKVQLRLFLRDENLDIMDAYLTNGGRSIPKLICLRQPDLQELGTWGPRPAPVQKMVMDFKAQPHTDYTTFTEELHRWYARDKAQTFEQELLACIRQWKATSSDAQ